MALFAGGDHVAAQGLVLALGGGGARGLAHLGVLQVLTKARVPLAGLVGTSMGAVVAALYGVGTDLKRLEEFTVAFPWEELLDLSFKGLGFSGGERAFTMLELLTKGRTFAELTLPVWVVATDLERGTSVVLREGPLATALRASISVPGFFAPWVVEGRTLVDGAVVAGVPVEIAREMGATVVAVDVGFDFQTRRARHVVDVLTRVVQIMGSELDRHQVAQADYVIRPEVGCVSSARFDQAGECVALGRRAAEEALPELWKLAKQVKGA
ncbi:MAG: patatin-like phospholipase family protein [Bacteroidota bacterium]